MIRDMKFHFESQVMPFFDELSLNGFTKYNAYFLSMGPSINNISNCEGKIKNWSYLMRAKAVTYDK